VDFSALGASSTRILLKLNYDPEGALENMADALGLVSARVGGDLDRFKQFIEKRGSATGKWQGEIEGRQVNPGGHSRLTGKDSAESGPRSKRMRTSSDDV
jgi:hypothetical protein